MMKTLRIYYLNFHMYHTAMLTNITSPVLICCVTESLYFFTPCF